MPSISQAEWEVMSVVWDRAPQTVTAGDIVDPLVPRHGWSPRTVKTMLNRLVKKGALGFKAEGKRYLYHAKVTREQCIREESRSFLDRVFGGEAGPMLNYFVQSVKLSPAEIEELRKLLKNKP
jgi:BlaI family transcriptional regulator, penicillinase repressor